MPDERRPTGPHGVSCAVNRQFISATTRKFVAARIPVGRRGSTRWLNLLALENDSVGNRHRPNAALAHPTLLTCG